MSLMSQFRELYKPNWLMEIRANADQDWIELPDPPYDGTLTIGQIGSTRIYLLVANPKWGLLYRAGSKALRVLNHDERTFQHTDRRGSVVQDARRGRGKQVRAHRSPTWSCELILDPKEPEHMAWMQAAEQHFVEELFGDNAKRHTYWLSIGSIRTTRPAQVQAALSPVKTAPRARAHRRGCQQTALAWCADRQRQVRSYTVYGWAGPSGCGITLQPTHLQDRAGRMRRTMPRRLIHGVVARLQGRRRR